MSASARVRAMRATLLALCAACGGPGSTSDGIADESSGRVRTAREDRILLTQFNEVSGVAASHRHVFIATPFGLGILDRQFSRWLPPVTIAEGYPREQPTALAADPSSDGVWIGTIGAVVIYRPSIDFLVRVPVPGIVDYIAFERATSNAFLRASGTWYRVSFNGLATRISQSELPSPAELTPPSTLEDVYREFPGLRSVERLLLRDQNLRSFPVTSGTRAPDRSEVWLGTDGDGVFQVDPNFQQATHRPFGLLDRGAGAITAGVNGVWIAGMGTGARPRAGVTFASTELQTWRWLTGPLNHPLTGSRALDVAMREDVVWVASDRGLARLSTRNERDLEFWSALNGLPSDQVFSLAPKYGGTWVGTSRGLVFVSDTAPGRRRGRMVSRALADGTPIRALLLTGDTLWIGSEAGLLLIPPGGENQVVRAAAVTTESRLARPIRALARNDSLVAIATDVDVMLIDITSGRLQPRLDLAAIGTVRDIRSLAMDESWICVAGGFGALMMRRSDGVIRALRPAGLYNEVEDIVLTPDYIWLATADGVTRLRRLADGSVF